MELPFKKSLWDQFGASIDMLENAIEFCPENLWNTKSQYWYICYHTLFFLDYYLSYHPEKFSPPHPFTLSEMDSSGLLPDRVYSKQELITYLSFCRNKCLDFIYDLDAEKSTKRFINEYKNYSIFEILLYNMRHLQHHTAQLNLLLRQAINDSPKWVSQAKKKKI